MRIKLFKYFESGHYPGIQNHPKFGIKYDSDGYGLINDKDHRLNDYLLEVIDLYPEIKITIFYDGHSYSLKKYLIQFTGEYPVVIENTSPLIEGPSVRTMTDCIDRLCEMENFTLESIQYISSSDGRRSSILFFLESTES
jgi:hypothetical protein